MNNCVYALVPALPLRPMSPVDTTDSLRFRFLSECNGASSRAPLSASRTTTASPPNDERVRRLDKNAGLVACTLAAAAWTAAALAESDVTRWISETVSAHGKPVH